MGCTSFGCSIDLLDVYSVFGIRRNSYSSCVYDYCRLNSGPVTVTISE